MALRPRADGLDDQLAVELAGARPRRAAGAVPRTPARRHPCPCRPTVPAKSRLDTSDEMAGFAGRAEGRPRPRTTTPAAFQVAAGRLAADPGGPFDPPQRPPQASQGQDLLSFVFSQDVAHAAQEHAVPGRRQRLEPLSEMAGFQLSTNGRI